MNTTPLTEPLHPDLLMERAAAAAHRKPNQEAEDETERLQAEAQSPIALLEPARRRFSSTNVHLTDAPPQLGSARRCSVPPLLFPVRGLNLVCPPREKIWDISAQKKTNDSKRLNSTCVQFVKACEESI